MLIKDAAKVWNISERRIRQLIKDNRISGASKEGMIWFIPDDTNKPFDKREKISGNNLIINLTDIDFVEIDNKLKLLNSKRPLSKGLLKSLQDNTFLSFTYNSTSIEGNTLTLKETKVVLEGITVGGKTIKEHLEIINHQDAIEYLQELIKDKKNLNEWEIKNIHKLILKDIDNDNAGRYRRKNVIISGAKHIPPNHLTVQNEMENLILKYNKWNYHPIIKAGLLHGEFVKIHPFSDGNGRTARLLMNFEAMKQGYVPLVIKKEDRLEYYVYLDNAHTTGDYTLFIKLLIDIENEMLDHYLNIID
jgi:Fic family protein